MLYCVCGYMFRSLHDHHQAFLRIKSRDAGYMLGSQLCLQFIQVYFFSAAQQFHPDSALKRSSKSRMKLTSAECTVENSR